MEEGQVTQEEYRYTLWVCKDGARKAKSHTELYLVREVKGNKKGY